MIENVQGRYNREWSHVTDGRLDRGILSQPQDRKSRVFVDPNTGISVVGDSGSEPTELELDLSLARNWVDSSELDRSESNGEVSFSWDGGFMRVAVAIPWEEVAKLPDVDPEAVESPYTSVLEPPQYSGFSLSTPDIDHDRMFLAVWAYDGDSRFISWHDAQYELLPTDTKGVTFWDKHGKPWTEENILSAFGEVFLEEDLHIIDMNLSVLFMYYDPPAVFTNNTLLVELD